MQERYGQLAKSIVRNALPPHGKLHTEHEVPVPDAQATDAYFIPKPAKRAELASLGWLGRIVHRRCLLEMIQSTPGAVVVRANVRKQLTLDHNIALEAAKKGRRRPKLLRLWMLCAGEPRSVLRGYGFKRVAGWPPGFWDRSRLDAAGIVVLGELPRQPDTLLLRLLGRGHVLKEAIEDLRALPEGAQEREIAEKPLVALRFELAQDPHPDQEARAILMAARETFEQWEKRTKETSKAEGLAKGRAEGLATGIAKGRAEGLARGRAEGGVEVLAGVYKRRFGPMPARLRSALAKRLSPETLSQWGALFADATDAEIAAALRNGKAPR